jgi:hypothetical protein
LLVDELSQVRAFVVDILLQMPPLLVEVPDFFRVLRDIKS